MVANYGANGGCFDNDDGSAFYHIHDNFEVFGSHKNDFGGHSKVSTGNLMVYAQVYGPRCFMLQGLPTGWESPEQNEGFVNNTCILADSTNLYFDIGTNGAKCDVNNKQTFTATLGGNAVYTKGAEASISCSGTYNFQQWMSYGLDQGTTIHDMIMSPQIIAMAKELLSIPTDA